ncbi:YbaB/EbfC family nucleoid-associated protein [Mycolicibacterium sp. HK-90]|uniref:YbaB/EbfC family nucleoid-associated protein n=1 Tax=Mycolicibacterium sp. HK-90 TaxID=3056937 RepID=UPI002657E360|nr:YbaB/EbfC family nucleoid-associated protein [Mycolicibacterium sp. HK-90]WKG03110.1 YbaB/EbfC family nucleoid-associated protein [Mycolicibacterium sp. HK-90]
MDNDGARHDLIEALALVQEQLADLAVVEQARAELSATGTRADGTVTMTVNADGVVVEAVVSETYLDAHELADLGGHITAAAQDAARDVARKLAELLAPLAQRRERMPSLSDVVEGAPDIRDLLLPPAAPAPYSSGYEKPNSYPTVRSVR